MRFSPGTKKSMYGFLVNYSYSLCNFYFGDYYPSLSASPPASCEDNSNHHPDHSHDADDKMYE